MFFLSRRRREIPNTAFESWDRVLSENKIFDTHKIFYARRIFYQVPLVGQKYSVKVGENPNISILDVEYGLKLILSRINVVRQTLDVFLQAPIDTGHFRDEKVIFWKKLEKEPFTTRFYVKMCGTWFVFFELFSKNNFLVIKTSYIDWDL